MQKLNRTFFQRDTIIVAKELLGKKIIFNNKECVINETEAYVGMDDPACHAACGKTKRNEVMFGKAGFSYIYLIYGMYNCLNFVTETEGFPSAVLVRGAETIIDSVTGNKIKLNGPGKLCRYLGITKEHSGIDITNSKSFFIENTSIIFPFKSTSRIGISKGVEKPWRFVRN
ncbi:DNA-3-methyladenine glycosylase [Pseudomonadota bacterium]